MNNLSREKKSQLVLVGFMTVTICAGLYFGLIQGQNERLAIITKRKNEMFEKLGKAERAMKNKAALHAELELRRTEIDEIEGRMATGDLYAWIIGTMNRRAAAHNLTIPSYGREVVGEVALLPKFPYKAATFVLKGSGRFEDFGRFVASLENEFPFVRVQNLDLTPAAALAAEDQGKIDFRFDLVVPIKPTLAAIANNESNSPTSR